MTRAPELTATIEWQAAFDAFDRLCAIEEGAQRDAAWAQLAHASPALAARARSLARAAQPNSKSAITEHLAQTLVQEPPAFQAGDVVGAFTLHEEIGIGGMSRVWKASRTDGTLQRFVALKLPSAQMPDHALSERFIREREILAQLDHPNIGKIFDAGISPNGLPFLALEYIDGAPLHTHCTQAKLSIRARVQLIAQAAHALHHAHTRLVLHRDVKPSNILVTGDGALKLLDFGIAKPLEKWPVAQDDDLTRMTGAPMTPKYAAPEQLVHEPITTSSDVYSLAVVLFELISGHLPHARGARDLTTRLSSLAEPAIALTHVKPSRTFAAALGGESDAHIVRQLRGDLAAILAKALRREPAERYSSAMAFAADLQRFLDRRPVAAKQGAVSYRVGKFLVRHWRASAATAAASVLVIGLGGNAIYQSQNAARAHAQARSVQQLLSGLFTGMSPDTAKTRTFTAKELLDRTHATMLASPSMIDAVPEITVQLSDLYRDVGEYQKAAALLRERLTRTPTQEAQIDLRIRIADALSKGDLFAQAETEIEQTQPLVAGLIQPHVLRARFLNIKGQLANLRANAELAADAHAAAEQELIALGSDDVEQRVWAIEGQGTAARWAGKNAQARAHFERAIAMDAARPVRGEIDRQRTQSFYLGLLVFEGEFAKARAGQLRLCESMNARLGGTHNETGTACRSAIYAHIRSGDMETARALIAAVGKHRADERVLYDQLEGLIALYSGDPISAEQAQARYIAHMREHGRSNAAAVMRMQRTQFEAKLRQGEDRAALAALTTLADAQLAAQGRQSVDLAMSQTLRGIALLRLGQTNEAREALDAAISVFSAHRSEAFPWLKSARAYAALAGRADDRSALARWLREEMPWQAGANALAEALESSAPRRFTDLPVVF